MGRGIVQVAAQAGFSVRIFDASEAAVQAAFTHLHSTLAMLQAKRRVTALEASETLARIAACESIGEMAGCDLIIEAASERLDIKLAIFKQLETVVGETCVLASNTSSLSITEIGATLTCPGRFAGCHFFNPVPLMKLVEVIKGIRTLPETEERLLDFVRRLGHTPIRARDMPGFVVNHAGRAMNTEGLQIAGEAVAGYADIDAIMREQAGFRLGPFELMDLTGLDVSHPVMEAIFRQFYDEPRFRPSATARARAQAGLFGKKNGEGFYRYADGKQLPAAQSRPHQPITGPLPKIWISQAIPELAERLTALLEDCGAVIDRGSSPAPDALVLVTPLGTDATAAVIAEGLDAGRTVAVDMFSLLEAPRRVTLMGSPAVSETARGEALALFAGAKIDVTWICDSTGFVAQRMLAMIVNTACDIAQQRIAAPADIDLAVQLGLGYPLGPLAIGDKLGARRILAILNAIHADSGDPRYRPSPWLLRRARLGISLRHEER